MFNGDLKRDSIKRLELSNKRYQVAVTSVVTASQKLHSLREKSAMEVISKSQDYVNQLSNSPKEINTAVSGLKISYSNFESRCHEIKLSDNVGKISGKTAGVGIASGVGIAALGPSAAMAIATTFGTASTGVAISGLSGAAAINAALAWLGGGALVAGGGGMAAGNALLALAGPIGWGIGGVMLVGAGFYARKKNRQIAEKATKISIEITKKYYALRTSEKAIKKLHLLTLKHRRGALKQLTSLRESAPLNYLMFSNDQKQELGALINNVKSLSQILNKGIEV